jgi:hypothetical protein
MIAGKHALQLNQINAGFEIIQPGDDLLIGLLVVLLFGQVQEHLGIFQLAEILLPDTDQILQLPQLPLDPLGFGLVVPKVRADRLPLQQFYLFTLAI